MPRTALVTGSTSGIGLGIAEALASAGFAIMLHGSRSAADAEPLRTRIATTHGVTAAYHSADVSKPGATATPDELMDFCKTLIAGYKCPRSVEVTQTPLPLSGAGKILKRELRKPYWENRQRMVS
jgi:NAD(P)-dependent dehydrogenase (short-subunit alcohol dehydrogenase family)